MPPLSGTAAASLVVHQVNIGYGVGESSGLLLAGEGGVTFRSRVGLAIRAAGGSLSTSTAGAENRDIGEVGVEASVIPAPWLALRASATSRTYSTAIARQRWTIVGVGAEARLDFATSPRSEEHTSELQSPDHLVCRLLLEKKKTKQNKKKKLPTPTI